MLTLSFAPRGLVALAVALGFVLVVSVAVPPDVAAQQASSPSALVKPDIPPDYVIGPGDILQIFVWKEPEVSREVRVRTDGKVTIPLVGDVAAAGATTQALGEGLAQKLKQYLNAPKVTVSLLASSSLRFFVVGEVNKPGEFLFAGRVTVLEALALAGGFKEEAKRDKIVIIRRDPNGQNGVAAAATRRPGDTIIRVNYKNLATGRDLRGNALLQPGDTVVVP